MEQAIQDIKNGKIVLVMDDKNRENEGDLIVAASKVTANQMAFINRFTTGIICAAMTPERACQLQLPRMHLNNTDNHQTQFTVSIDLVSSTTGVSAVERTATVNALSDINSKPQDFTKPGHIFPLVSRGISNRKGHTEAGVALCQLAKLEPVAVLSELISDLGEMLRYKECLEFAKKHNINIITVQDIANFCKVTPVKNPELIMPVLQSETPIKLQSKNFNLQVQMQIYTSLRYNTALPDLKLIVILYGDIYQVDTPLRIHSECFTGDILHSVRCDCGSQLDEYLAIMKKKKSGVLIYIQGHEGRGIGLINKLKCYQVQQSLNLDTVEANTYFGFDCDYRDYKDALKVLQMLKLSHLNLYTNNPNKSQQLNKIINKITPLRIKPTPENKLYLKTKQLKCHHNLHLTL